MEKDAIVNFLLKQKNETNNHFYQIEIEMMGVLWFSSEMTFLRKVVSTDERHIESFYAKLKFR